MTPVLEVEDLYFSYGSDWVIEGANLSLEEGDFSALIGSNGAGKTTLIRLLLGILPPTRGRIFFRGQELDRGVDFRNLSYVPQLMAGADHFPISVEELVGLSLYKELRGFRRLSRDQKKRISGALDLVGLRQRQGDLYQDLSGGQRQRVLLAKALVSLPEVLILDEPTTGIDSQTRRSLFDLLYHLNQDHGISILMITHELQAVEELVDRVYILEEGKIRVRGRR